MADIATVIDVMSGNAPEYKVKADVNNDKTVDVADISTIIDNMAGKVGESACPNAKHPHWIDLGLPSGTQWRCCNEGASSPEVYGGNYTFDEAQAYNPPSLNQIKEFLNNTTSEWTTQIGVSGCMFTSKINGVSVFLPAAGYVWDWDGPLLSNVGWNGYYWSSTYYNEDNAYYFYFYSGSAGWSNYGRFRGYSVRPVR